MQTLFSMVSLTIIIHGLILQSIWLYAGRLARDRYLSDIMSFRPPSSSLSRFYHWRVNSFTNALVEGVLFLIILIGSIISFTTIIYGFELMLASSAIIVFIVFLSLISALQHAWRVREVVDSESRIIDSVNYAKDKIGVTKTMVDDLYMQGPMGDGRMWFALFRLAQRQDTLGWSIRDVLMTKAKEEDTRFQSTKSSSGPQNGKGPEIDS